MSATTTPSPRSKASHFDVFLSYNSRDRPIVERIAERLKRAGIEPWLDKWSLTPGGDWQRELGAGLDASVACAVFVGPHDLGAWELQEIAVAIDRAATQHGFRVFPVLLPGVEEPFDPNRLPHFLRARTWVDFRRGRDDGRALQHLINAVKGVPFGPDIPVAPSDDIAPYRGLRVFGEEDAQFFFGRDREIQRLLEKLKSSPFVAVLGSSGSGKSSLVRAGLVPELRAGALAAVEHWHVCVLRPGAAPLTALAAQVVKLLPDQAMAVTLDALTKDPRTLHLCVELALADKAAGERVLVIVDQLEEVFTLCRDEGERGQLFSTLLYATSAPGGRTVAVVTMRADFYPRCAPYPEFAQLITAQQMLVGPMDSDGLRQAVEEPARRVGLQLEEGLTETILADVAAEPGALPLLEHALLELWERRRGAMLTLEGYREAGGVQGALAQRADEIFEELSPVQQQLARRALLRLTEPGEGSEDTRRRATRRELAPAEATESFDAVIGRLVDARMLTTGRDETGQEVVDVSHEALIRGWPRLRGWIDADRAGLLIHRRLTEAAREWDTLDREPAALYRGARLATAREWSTDHVENLSRLEHDFLTASSTMEENELQAAQRRTRRLRHERRLGAAQAAVLAALVALFVYVTQPQTVEHFELQTLDLRFDIRGPASADPRILLVGRDDRTLASSIGDNRAEHARVLDAIDAARPAAIINSFQYTAQRDPVQTERLVRSIRRARSPVVLAAENFDSAGDTTVLGRKTSGKDKLFGATIGHGRLTPDAGVVRHMRAIDAPWLPSLAGRAAEVAGISPADLPLEGRIDYAGEAGTYPHVSFVDTRNGRVPSPRFKDKIVVIGDTGLGDHGVRRYVPIGTSVTPMSRGEILANEIATALDEFPLREGPVWATVLLIVTLAIVPAALAIRYRTGAAVGLSLAAGAAFLVGAQAAYAAGWILPVITPLLALVLSVVASQVAARMWPGQP